jgi:hypothetical protein
MPELGSYGSVRGAAETAVPTANAGTTKRSAHSTGRRPKRSKARSRGSWAPARQRALWRFNAGADVDDGREARTTPAAYLQVREVGRMPEAFWPVFGAH